MPASVSMGIHPEVKSCFDLGRVLVLNDPPAAREGGLLRTSNGPAVSPRVCMRTHPEGKSCGHVQSRFLCLFSMTLLLGAGNLADEKNVKGMSKAG